MQETIFSEKEEKNWESAGWIRAKNDKKSAKLFYHKSAESITSNLVEEEVKAQMDLKKRKLTDNK